MPLFVALKKRLHALELYTVDVIFGRREDTGATIYGAFLQALSYLFNGLVQLRYWLYGQRILHDQPLGCLVVVVGNLTVGGTGKTPVVENSRGPCATAVATSPSLAAATKAKRRRSGKSGGTGSATPTSRRRAWSATAAASSSTVKRPATSPTCSHAISRAWSCSWTRTA